MNDALHHPPKPRHDDWCTPHRIIDAVREAFHGPIGLDPCSNAESIVGARVEYRLPEHDGLVEPWHQSTIYVNPPYGRGIDRWMARCLDAARSGGSEVIALLPATPDTKAWHDYVEQAQAVCFVHGRITFLGAPSAAPNPSALVYWGPCWLRFARALRPTGSIWKLAGAASDY
jgi:hypothetical protein